MVLLSDVLMSSFINLKKGNRERQHVIAWVLYYVLLETSLQMSSFPVWSSVSGLVFLLGRSEIAFGMGTVSCMRSKLCLPCAQMGPRLALSLVPSECWEACVVTESGLATEVPCTLPG